MRDKGNIGTRWSKYFVSNVDPNKNGLSEVFIKIPRIFYSFEAKRKVAKLLDDFRPDLVHLNNIYYYISPSIISEIKSRGIPIVQTVHDYQMINPNVSMYHSGKICEITKGKKYYKAIFHKCVGNSYIGSLLSAIGLYIQNIGNSYFKNIDVFITPSNFMKKKLIEEGVMKSKLFHLNNFVETVKQSRSKHTFKKYILYFGRLSEAKGIFKLIDLAHNIPDIKIVIAGSFDEYNDKKIAMQMIKNHKINNLLFVGFQDRRRLKNLIAKCEFVIVPSCWYENQPYSILESYALGKSVVASKIGGIPEIVINRKTGLLFDSKNIQDLKAKILLLWNNPSFAKEMGRNARIYLIKKFNSDRHYNDLMKIYSRTIHSNI